MTINTWNTIIPESQALNNLPPSGGTVVFSHDLRGTAPVIGSWLGLIPRTFAGFYIRQLEIVVPYCDSNATPTLKWQLGTFNYDTGVMNTGDSSLYAGEQYMVTGGGTAQQLLVNGQSTGFYTAGTFGGGSALIRAAVNDLLEYTPPFERFSNSSLGIGLVCTTAPATWSPTDVAPKKLFVSMSLSPRAPRS